MTTICLITSTHVSANPRLRKEAEAFTEAGYQVHVIATDVNERLRRLDQPILSSANWTYSLVRRPNPIIYACLTLVQRVARYVLARGIRRSLRVAIFAHHRLSRRLGRLAVRTGAQIYLAHNLAALPAAAHAAGRNKAKLGFDAEDFHSEELTPEQRDAGDQIARRVIEEQLLKRCAYLTASSPLIAQAYRESYEVHMTSILNVSPIAETPPVSIPVSKDKARSLYWFSQTIGHGRGLEEILNALAEMRHPPELFLQGTLAEGYEQNLGDRARGLGLRDFLHFLAPVPPNQIVRNAAQYQIGLAPEPGSSSNNDLALSNKLFAYLLAGIPVVLSRTPAQLQIAQELGPAAVLVDIHQPLQVAAALESFFADEDHQRLARAEAWRLGQERYNWDTEKHKLLPLLGCISKDN